MADHHSIELSNSSCFSRREMIRRTAVTGIALGTIKFSNKYADAKDVEQSTLNENSSSNRSSLA